MRDAVTSLPVIVETFLKDGNMCMAKANVAGWTMGCFMNSFTYLSLSELVTKIRILVLCKEDRRQKKLSHTEGLPCGPSFI